MSHPERPSPSPWRRLLAGLVLLSLLFGAWGVWTVASPGDQAARLAELERLTREQRAQLETLQQALATLKRSDQISREANLELQGTLAERDEEVAGLRADVAFYERLVGATGQRRGLTVHALRLQPQESGIWRFTATLTQNLNRGAISRGRLVLGLEGSQAGRLQKLDWADLRQDADAPGVDYSFKYFQQVEGDIVLPPGLTPTRVVVRLVPRDGAAVEESFAWDEVVNGEAGAGR